MVTQAGVTHLVTQPHQNYNRNEGQPSFWNVRNRVEWKSDDYGIKETTSIQTGRRGTDTERVDPTPTMVDKSSGGISWGHRAPHPHWAPSLDSRARKISPHNFWLQRPVRIELVGEATGP